MSIFRACALVACLLVAVNVLMAAWGWVLFWFGVGLVMEANND